MAEPARKLPEEDQPNIQPGVKPKLRAMEGGGQGDGQPAGELHSVKDSKDKTKTKKPASSTELQGAESTTPAEAISSSQAERETDTVGKGFTVKSNTSRVSKFISRVAGTRNKKLLIGGGLGGAGIISVLLFGLLALIPLKIEHIVNNLRNHFFATSDSAIQNETDSLFESYITSRVLPGYKSCGTTVSKDCQAIQFGSNPVSNLYRSWSNARLENKLADDYKITFQYDTANRVWTINAPGVSQAESIGADGSGLSDVLNTSSTNETRQAIRTSLDSALNDETRSSQVFTRYKVGRLLEEKYGIKRCIIFCGVRDALHDSVADQKQAAKLFLVQRVITPRDKTLGIALECLLTDCDATDTQPNDDPAAPAEAGAAGNTEVDEGISSGLRSLAATFGISDEESLTLLETTYNDISEQGFQKYLISKGLAPIIGDASADTAADKIPIAGWINLAAQIVNASNDANGTIKKLRYVTNAAAAVSLYMMYRTYADEIHTGNNPGQVTATEVGSMVDSLGPGNSGGPNDPELGGTASAEATPLYGTLIDGNSPSSTSYTDYKCNDGRPVSAQPNSQSLVCPEESLGGGNSLAATIHDFINVPPGNVIVSIAQLWRNTVGHLFNFLNIILGPVFQGIASGLDAACSANSIATDIVTGGYCTAKSTATAAFSPIVEGVTKWLIPDPFSSNMSGGRTFDEMAAGADVSGNDSAHTILGGQALTAQQTATIVNSQEAEAKNEFDHQPLFARLFSTDSQYSLVSKLAMDIPVENAGSLMQSSVASIFSNPFGKIMTGFSSIFAHKTSAATLSSDPFDVTQYGYPDGTIPTNPETYWDQHCSDNASQGYQSDSDYASNNWDQAAASNIDPNTGMPTNTTTDPCLLIKATVGAAGGYFSTSNLTADDLADSGATP